MGDLLGGVLEIAVALSESATLGSETARGPGLLLLGHDLTFSLTIPLTALTTGSGRPRGSRLASVGQATHVVHASGVIGDSLAVVLLIVVAVAAQRAHTASALMVC